LHRRIWSAPTNKPPPYSDDPSEKIVLPQRRWLEIEGLDKIPAGLFSVLLAMGVAALPSAAAIPRTVKVESGLVSGPPVIPSVFKGIPYAAPPVLYGVSEGKPEGAELESLARVGGLHQRYVWKAAA
jgi:hypothetical protein